MLTTITRLARGAASSAPSRRCTAAFTLVEVVAALSVVSIGFLGAFAMVLQGGKLASAAEEEALVCTGLEQRMDQIRSLDWGPLTDGTGLTSAVWTARPESVVEIPATQETMTISGYDLPTGQTLNATWDGISSPSVSFTAGTQALSTAGRRQGGRHADLDGAPFVARTDSEPRHDHYERRDLEKCPSLIPAQESPASRSSRSSSR